MLDLADEHRLRAAEVQQEYVADTVLDTDAHAVRRGGIVSGSVPGEKILIEASIWARLARQVRTCFSSSLR